MTNQSHTWWKSAWARKNNGGRFPGWVFRFFAIQFLSCNSVMVTNVLWCLVIRTLCIFAIACSYWNDYVAGMRSNAVCRYQVKSPVGVSGPNSAKIINSCVRIIQNCQKLRWITKGHNLQRFGTLYAYKSGCKNKSSWKKVSFCSPSEVLKPSSLFWMSFSCLIVKILNLSFKQK